MASDQNLCADPLDQFPLHEREVGVRFKHRLHRRADLYLLAGIAEQIADHARIVRVREFDENHDIGAVSVQRRVDRMMWPLVGVDAALARDLLSGEVERMAAVTEPFRPPLPRTAAAAFLDAEPPRAGRFPVGCGERIGGVRRGQAFRQIGFHSVASEPRMIELTGVTIGPPMMIAVSLRAT